MKKMSILFSAMIISLCCSVAFGAQQIYPLSATLSSADYDIRATSKFVSNEDIPNIVDFKNLAQIADKELRFSLKQSNKVVQIFDPVTIEVFFEKVSGKDSIGRGDLPDDIHAEFSRCLAEGQEITPGVTDFTRADLASPDLFDEQVSQDNTSLQSSLDSMKAGILAKSPDVVFTDYAHVPDRMLDLSISDDHFVSSDDLKFIFNVPDVPSNVNGYFTVNVLRDGQWVKQDIVSSDIGVLELTIPGSDFTDGGSYDSGISGDNRVNLKTFTSTKFFERTGEPEPKPAYPSAITVKLRSDMGNIASDDITNSVFMVYNNHSKIWDKFEIDDSWTQNGDVLLTLDYPWEDPSYDNSLGLDKTLVIASVSGKASTPAVDGPSSSGCNVGIGPMSLLLLAPLLTFRSRK